MHRHAGHQQVPTTRQILGSSCRLAATARCSCHHHNGAISSYSSCCWEATHATAGTLPLTPPQSTYTGTSPLQDALALPPPTHTPTPNSAPSSPQRLRRPVLDESSHSTVSSGRAVVHGMHVHDSPGRQQPPVSQPSATYTQPQPAAITERQGAGRRMGA